MSSSNSDIEVEERVSNVNSLMIKLEDKNTIGELQHEDCKRRLGDLIFDANYEGANLGHVECVDRCEYDLMIRPDVTNQAYSLWFNFTIKNYHKSQVSYSFSLFQIVDYMKYYKRIINLIYLVRYTYNCKFI